MKLSVRDTVLLAILAVAVLAGGTYMLLVKGANADASATRERVVEVEARVSVVQDTLARLEADSQGEAERTAERLRLAKAIPGAAAVPGTLVQLQRLADRANVEFSALKTTSHVGYGAFAGTELEVKVTGRFFDVDDFLYRMHRMVRVDGRDNPVVKGRLLAVTGVKIDLAESVGTGVAGSRLGAEDKVEAGVSVVAFSDGDGSDSASPDAPVADSDAEPSGDGSGSEPQDGEEATQ